MSCGPFNLPWAARAGAWSRTQTSGLLAGTQLQPCRQGVQSHITIVQCCGPSKGISQHLGQAASVMHKRTPLSASTALSTRLASQVAVWLGVDVRMLTAFPTARGLARHMQQAATNQGNAGTLRSMVRTTLTVSQGIPCICDWRCSFAGMTGLYCGPDLRNVQIGLVERYAVYRRRGSRLEMVTPLATRVAQYSTTSVQGSAA